MQLGLPFGAQPRAGKSQPPQHTLLLDRRPVVVTYVSHRRARHYVLRVQDDGSVRVTVPRAGNRREAERFVREKADWIERERYRVELRRAAGKAVDESRVMVNGEDLAIEVVEQPGGSVACFGSFRVPLAPAATGPLPDVERFLRQLAADQLPPRLFELAAEHGRTVRGVTIRGQRTRWGSCSPAGRISLNWRLIQMPPAVRDYVLLHELTHLVHLNHSKRFWRELERACPWHREARAWLKTKAAGPRGSR